MQKKKIAAADISCEGIGSRQVAKSIRDIIVAWTSSCSHPAEINRGNRAMVPSADDGD
jgi:hypothetical protein